MHGASLPDRDPQAGLTDAQARERLAQFGPNELPDTRDRSLMGVVARVLREPMVLLLAACSAVYMIVGDRGEAAMLIGSVALVVLMTVYQERKSERALEALRDLASPRARVLRDGRATHVAGRDVVPGDLLLLAEGDRIAADAMVLASTSLSVDESMLSGESVPVRKRPIADERVSDSEALPGGEDRPWVWSGTLVVQGTAVARVLQTGPRTQFGRIGGALQSLDPGRTRVQRETDRVVRSAAMIGGAVSALLALAWGLREGDWLGGLLAGLTLAMGILPEELPLVLTIFLALGAWRISRERVLTRRVPAIETLGAATVLCVDKTGTLTQNRMQLAECCVDGRLQSLEPHRQETATLSQAVLTLLEFGVLASHRDPFDPMERAIHEAAVRAAHGAGLQHSDWILAGEYPLSPALLAMSRAWRAPAQEGWTIAAKGAPEAIVDLCHLPADQCAKVLAAAHAMASRGLRVIGVARARTACALPVAQHDFDFEWLGLLGLRDPLRAQVPEAVRACHEAGIRVVMITGDHPATAAAIAREAGLGDGAAALTGQGLAAMSPQAMREAIRRSSVFCRVTPAQKLAIVQALQAAGEVVAMTGDGVNDAPALKAADIGIAMGARGTDVAREAAALVLLEDDFASIVAAVRQGRRIFDNLRHAVGFVLAVHVPVVGLSLVPVMVGGPPILMAMHIVFLELIIDPACTFVYEAEPAGEGVMRRPPRPAHASLFEATPLLVALFEGLLLLTACLAMQWLALNAGLDAEAARTLSFTTLVFGSLGIILANRSRRSSVRTLRERRNRAWGWVTAATVLSLGVVLAWPAARHLFHLGLPSLAWLSASVGMALAAFAGFEGLKRMGWSRSS